MRKLNDYELVSLYKTTSEQREREKVIEIFYVRYMPLMKYQANKYLRYLSKDRCVEFDDLVSTYAEWLYKAMDYIDCSKVYNKDTFTFGGIYRKFLTSYSMGWAKGQNELNRCISIHPGMMAPRKTLRDAKKMEEKEELVVKAIDSYKGYCPKPHVKILDMLMDGMKPTQIQKALGYKNPANITYHKRRIRESVEREIRLLENE